VRVNVTEVEEVYASPLLITMDPVGVVLSFLAPTPHIVGSRRVTASKINAANNDFLFKEFPLQMIQ
jgi:hypothetical protein